MFLGRTAAAWNGRDLDCAFQSFEQTGLKRAKVDLDGEALSANVPPVAFDDSLGDCYRSGNGKPELMNEKRGHGKYEEPFDAESSGYALPFLAYSAELVVGEDIVHPLDWHF